MSWTTLLAEYLIIGVQTAFCLLLILLLIDPGMEVVTLIQGRFKTEVLIIVGIAYTYSIGMVMDKLIHILTHRILKNRTQKLYKSEVHYYDAEDAIYGQDGQLARLNRRRGRFRIIRAFIFNVLLVAPLCFALTGYWWVIIVGLMMLAGAVLAYLDIHVEYVRMVKRKADTI